MIDPPLKTRLETLEAQVADMRIAITAILDSMEIMVKRLGELKKTNNTDTDNQPINLKERK